MTGNTFLCNPEPPEPEPNGPREPENPQEHQPPPVTVDHLLGGAVTLSQPRRGYRVAIDAPLLAAATLAQAGERVADLGTGVGAVALCLAHRVAGIEVVGLERQPALASLATANCMTNGLADRVSIVTGDLRQLPASLCPASFHHVMANPPYLRAGAHTPAEDRSRAIANGEEAPLAAWVRCALSLLRPRGTLTMIHRADRIDEILALLHPRFGEIVVFPLWPHAGQSANRVLVRGRRDRHAPARLAPGLVLHEAQGGYTATAEAILRGGEALQW